MFSAGLQLYILQSPGLKDGAARLLLDLAFEQQNTPCDQHRREAGHDRKVEGDAGEPGILQQQILERIYYVGEWIHS